MADSRPPFKAKFDGTCAYAANGQCKHGGRIARGQEIKWNRTVKGKAWHVECENAGASLPPTPPESAAYDGPPPEGDDTLAAALVAALEPRLKLKAQVSAEEVAALVEVALAPMRKKVDALGVATRVEIKNTETGEIADLGIQHKQFPVLLAAIGARLSDGHRINVWLAGPAGSGKTTAAQLAAKALGLEFGFTGAIDTPYPLVGFIDAHGRCVRTPFRERYEHGGVFLFDEYDGSNPSATLPFNAALANGHCAFPDAIVARHPDFVGIAAANTWGLGGTAEYVGRNRLDAASLDRFVSIGWEVDEALELATAGNTAWVSRVQAVRKAVARQGIKVIISPRASYFGAALLAAGMTQPQVEALTLRKGMTEDQWQSVS
jgi:hypothetical protein